MSAPAAAIDRIEAWACSIPLERPLQLGDVRVEQRDFVVARVTTADGATGAAYALSRGAPVDLVLADLVAPVVLGRDSRDIPRRLEECARALVTLGTVGLVQRAVSLLDICLWDLKAKSAGLPLWRLLGGYADRAPVMLVAPYAEEGEQDEAYADRVGALVAQGYHTIKLYPLPDPAAMARRLDCLRRRIGDGPGLVVDMAWAWRRAEEAVAAVHRWERFGLAWVEDPMPADQVDEFERLSLAVETPIAAGDEASVPFVIEHLLERRAVDLLRLDATTIGGISEVARLHTLARHVGRPVSPHAYPEIHQHCVHAWPGVGPIEAFPPESPTWGAHRFIGQSLRVDGDSGLATAPEVPGLGLDIDWEAVDALAARCIKRTSTKGAVP